MMCLDVLRAMRKEPLCRDALIDELRRHRGTSRVFDQGVDRLADRLGGGDEDEGAARELVTRMALALQAGELLAHSPAEMAELFIDTRLGGEWTGIYGTLPAPTPCRPSSNAPP